MISDLWLAIIAIALIAFAMLMVALERALTRVSRRVLRSCRKRVCEVLIDLHRSSRTAPDM